MSSNARGVVTGSSAIGAGRAWAELSRCEAGSVKPILESKVMLAATPFSDLYEVKASFGDFDKTYYVSEHGERAGMVLVHDDRVLLVRQYRLLIDGLSWELPGGSISDGETPAHAAARECLEETGLRPLNPHPLLTYHLGLDTLLNPTFLFYATEFDGDGKVREDEREECRPIWVTLSECRAMIRDGRVRDSFSLLGLLAYFTLAEPGKGK